MTTLVRAGTNAAWALQGVGHEARQGRTGRNADGRTGVVGEARGTAAGRQDAHRARILGGGEGTRQGSAATGIAVNGAPGDVGQHGERAGSAREPRRLGDKHMLVISIQGGHQGDWDAGEGVVDHECGEYGGI